MAQYFKIHPDNPQQRLITQSIAIIRQGGVIAYPTDSCYALGCLIGIKSAQDRMLQIRGLNPGHPLTIICRDLSEISSIAKVENTAFRLIKRLTPGPYTFLLKASRDIPKRLQHSKRKTIGLRVPDNQICQALLEALAEPLLSTSMVLPGQDIPETDPLEINDKIGPEIDLILDGGSIGSEVTTIIDMAQDSPEIIRAGKGDVSFTIN